MQSTTELKCLVCFKSEDDCLCEKCDNCCETKADCECKWGICEACDDDVGDDIIVHDFGCVALCEHCSMDGGEPHCPRGRGCDWCDEKYEEMDEEKKDE